MGILDYAIVLQDGGAFDFSVSNVNPEIFTEDFKYTATNGVIIKSGSNTEIRGNMVTISPNELEDFYYRSMWLNRVEAGRMADKIEIALDEMIENAGQRDFGKTWQFEPENPIKYEFNIIPMQYQKRWVVEYKVELDYSKLAYLTQEVVDDVLITKKKSPLLLFENYDIRLPAEGYVNYNYAFFDCELQMDNFVKKHSSTLDFLNERYRPRPEELTDSEKLEKIKEIIKNNDYSKSDVEIMAIIEGE